MITYCDIQYHLKEQDLVGQKPENTKELSNLHYNSLQNIVKCIFRVDKKRLKILTFALEYSF